MDYGGWYDLETRDFKHLQDITFIAAMLPPGGGRNLPTMRYLRHFSLIYLQPFESESLLRIFNTIMDWFFESQTPPLQKTLETMKE
jgi:dynein heavy chain